MMCFGILLLALEKASRQRKVGRLAQLGEHLPYKQGVTGSSPVSSTIWRSSSAWLECQPVTLEVEGSSPFCVAR